MSAKRVVITGVGLLSPIGDSLSTLKESFINYKSGIEYIKEWDKIDGLKTKVGGVVKMDDFSQIPRKYRRSMDRVALLSAIATKEAIKDSGLSEDEISHYRSGIAFGSTMGGNETLFDYVSEIKNNLSIHGQNSMGFLKIMSHTVAANLAQMFKIKGRNIPTCSACTSSSQAIGAGYESIKYGMSDIMICGGAEGLHYLASGVFDIMSAASKKYNLTPSLTPKPFDRDRDGLVVSEGAGVLILEEYERAKKRGAKIYGEVIGYATSCDGSHITTPSQDGMEQVMKLALEDAKILPQKVDYINAHATATHKGDIIESKATYNIFGSNTPISSTKGYMGHLLGGCGAVESIISLLAINENFLPANKNLENLDSECLKLDYLFSHREKKVDIVMNNNFAFGGINTSLIFKRV